MKIINREGKLDVEKNENTDRNSKAKSNDIDARKNPEFPKVAKGKFEIGSYHFIGVSMSQQDS